VRYKRVELTEENPQFNCSILRKINKELHCTSNGAKVFIKLKYLNVVTSVTSDEYCNVYIQGFWSLIMVSISLLLCNITIVYNNYDDI
jgi:hypothetical protein